MTGERCIVGIADLSEGGMGFKREVLMHGKTTSFENLYYNIYYYYN